MKVFLGELPFREPCQWNPFAVNRIVYYYSAARARRARPGTPLPLGESTGAMGEQHSSNIGCFASFQAFNLRIRIRSGTRAVSFGPERARTGPNGAEPGN